MPEKQHIVLLSISDLIPDPKNARHHPAENLGAICTSLQAFGQQKPIIVDGENKVVAGNGTLSAAISLGFEKIWAIKTALTGHAALAYAIADNRTGELSEWDYQALALTLAQMTPANIENSGFLESSSTNIQNLAKKIESEHANARTKKICCPNCGAEQPIEK